VLDPPLEPQARVRAMGGVSSEATMGFYSGYPRQMKPQNTQMEVIVK